MISNKLLPKTAFFSICGMALSLIFLTQSCPPPTSKATIVLPEDCFPERETTKEMAPQNGTIQKIGTIYAVVSEADGRRFGPCNLEKQWEEVGKKVIFSGLEKKIAPYERLAAIPFVLHTIAAAKE